MQHILLDPIQRFVGHPATVVSQIGRVLKPKDALRVEKMPSSQPSLPCLLVSQTACYIFNFNRRKSSGCLKPRLISSETL